MVSTYAGKGEKGWGGNREHSKSRVGNDLACCASCVVALLMNKEKIRWKTSTLNFTKRTSYTHTRNHLENIVLASWESSCSSMLQCIILMRRDYHISPLFINNVLYTSQCPMPNVATSAMYLVKYLSGWPKR